MSSANKTGNLGLNLWSATDPVAHVDFNADNEKLDASATELTKKLDAASAELYNKISPAVTALQSDIAQAAQSIGELSTNGLKLEMGTYTGTGTYGSDSTLTFSFTPKIVVISISASAITDYPGAIFLTGQPYNLGLVGGWAFNSNYRSLLSLTWKSNSVSWCSIYNNTTEGAFKQLNGSYVYHYFAIG